MSWGWWGCYSQSWISVNRKENFPWQIYFTNHKKANLLWVYQSSFNHCVSVRDTTFKVRGNLVDNISHEKQRIKQAIDPRSLFTLRVNELKTKPNCIPNRRDETTSFPASVAIIGSLQLQLIGTNSQIISSSWSFDFPVSKKCKKSILLFNVIDFWRVLTSKLLAANRSTG